jgi:RNA polymerase sigma-70 factor (ECF subfamily)
VEDKELVKNILKGNKELFREIVEKYQEFVYNLSYWLLRDKTDAEDATQEVFIKLYLNLKKFNFRHTFKNWLYKIVTNHCKDKLRRKKVEAVALEENLHQPASAGSYTNNPNTENPYHILLLRNCINELPEKYKTILIMYYFENKDYKEIAKITKLPYSTVRVHLFRARKILYKKLKHF